MNAAVVLIRDEVQCVRLFHDEPIAITWAAGVRLGASLFAGDELSVLVLPGDECELRAEFSASVVEEVLAAAARERKKAE